jgi:hypothetical protein
LGSSLPVDTSSYPRANTAPTNPLDTVQKLGALQQQQQSIQSNAIVIDKQKLDLANQKWGYIGKQLSTLAVDPDLDQNKVVDNLQQMTKMGLLTPDDMAKFITTMPTKPELLRPFIQQKLQQGMDTHEALNWMYGQQGEQNTGQTVTPTLSSPRPGFSPTGAVKPAGAPIQIQPPPTTPTIGPNNAPQLLGAQPPQLPPGTVQQPGGLPGQNVPAPGSQAPIIPNRVQALPVGPAPVGPISNPAITGPSNNLGGNVIGATVGPNLSPNDRVSQGFEPRGPIVGRPPGVTEAATTAGTASGGQLAQDRLDAAHYQREIFPLEQAIPALEKLGTKGTGPGTEIINNIKSFILSNVPGVKESDLASVKTYDEAKKYLTDFVNQTGNSGTNDKLAAAFSGNPSTHISNAAAVDVAKSALALRRMKQAQIIEFGKTGQPESSYAQWATNWGNTQDARAYGFDLMTPDSKEKLLKSLTDKQKAVFVRSLRIAHDASLTNPISQQQ